MLEDQKENLLFSKMFGVSPKYKFKLTLAHKELWKNERPCGIIVMNLGAKYLVFVSSSSVKLRELSFAQFVHILFGGSVSIFQFLNDEINNYVLFDIIVNFFIQKLRNKYPSSKSLQSLTNHSTEQ